MTGAQRQPRLDGEDGAGGSAAALARLRRSGNRAFAALGLPTVKDEAWKYTNISQLARTDYALPGAPAAIPTARIDQARLPGCRQLVFVDGHHVAALSEPALEGKILATSLLTAAEQGSPLPAKHLARQADHRRRGFTALNAALLQDGALIHVARGQQPRRPLQLIHVSTAHARPTAIHTRNVVILEEASRLTLVETFLASGDSLVNSVSELFVGRCAGVERYKLLADTASTRHIAALHGELADEASLSSAAFLWGGGLVRDEIDLRLAGEHASCALDGLFLADGERHVDSHSTVRHDRPRTSSRQLYKGVLDDRARGVFSGRVEVARDAQQTDARQRNMNLLLSPDARINTRPQLEIYADDVRCTHGATIGQLDEQALFYLRSRGIGAAEARRMLIAAFAAEALERVALPPLQAQLQRQLERRLAGERPR